MSGPLAGEYVQVQPGQALVRGIRIVIDRVVQYIYLAVWAAVIESGYQPGELKGLVISGQGKYFHLLPVPGAPLVQQPTGIVVYAVLRYREESAAVHLAEPGIYQGLPLSGPVIQAEDYARVTGIDIVAVAGVEIQIALGEGVFWPLS